MYDRYTVQARAVLLASDKDSEDSAMKRLMGEFTCFNAVFANDMVEERHVHIPPELLRGMLAERALLRSGQQASALTGLPLQPKYDRPWFAMTGRNSLVDEMGACIADTNPAGVLALIHTEPASGAEGTAFAALSDNLGKCLRIGAKLQANRQSLRAALADALFQRLNSPISQAPAPAAGAATR